MDRAAGEIFPPQERPRTGGLQDEKERTGPSSQGSSFSRYGTGDQFNAPEGKLNITKGPGNQFPGATFHAPVFIGTTERFDPLRECLRSLAFPEMDSRFNDIDAATQGTCKWLLQHQTYTRWSSCDRGLLWIKGKPGSGKSTLLWNVLNDATLRLKTGERALILKFFFHGRGTELQRTSLGLFRSLLYQLSQVPDALSELAASFQQRCENVGKPGEKWQWHPRELQRFSESSLLKVLRTRPVWLFVDALDECGEENAVNLAEEFKSLLQRLPPSGLKQLHICFTCRHYPILDLDGVFEVCVEKENQEDISTFVQDKLSSFRGRTSSTIPDLIIKRADGVFLWARLMVKRVLDLEREGIGLKKIEAKIRSVPQELDALYCELIRNMRSESLKLVQWICFATRPLSLDELRWAMAIEPDCRHRLLRECESAGDFPPDYDGMKRRVQTLSRGLAEVTSDTKVIQFVHQSVKDFFVEKGLSALDESANPDPVVGMAHFRLARICIRYLAMEEIDRSTNYGRDKLIIDFSFLHYATTSWVAHTKQSDARSVPQEDLLEYFAGPSNTLMERWVRIYRILQRHSNDRPLEGTSLVHVMSRYGVAGVLRAILERADQVGIYIDASDSHDRTPLSYAAENGNEAVVRLLLDRGVDIDAVDTWGRTPLSWAAENRHESVVRLLLDRGANTEAAGKIWGRTPLSWAAERGHEAIVRLLLDRGADTDAVDTWGRTPLSWAAKNGHEAVVRLLDRGAHTEAADGRGRTLPSWAAERGDKAVVRLLSANTETVDTEDRTLLLSAAALGDEAVVRLLLDRGADTDAVDEDGRTPLSWAAKNGHEAVVQLLLDRGANTEAVDKEGRTLLLWAAARGREAIVWLLLEWGANTEAADEGGWTPLVWAAGIGREAIVRLLLDRGANTEAADEGGRTPLLSAATMGHEAIVRLLLDRGANTEAADEGGRTPLVWAAGIGREAIVRLLLDRGANTEAADEMGRTPLSRAAGNGDEAVVRLLLDGGAHIEAADMRWGQTPLSYAAANGHEAVVRLLQFHGAQPSSTTSP